MDQSFKLITPDINRLLERYKEVQNPEQPSRALMGALDPFFNVMRALAPFPKNDEAKGIWITVPRGDISDWADFVY